VYHRYRHLNGMCYTCIMIQPRDHSTKEQYADLGICSVQHSPLQTSNVWRHRTTDTAPELYRTGLLFTIMPAI
jgi:hypothetical protein